MITTNSAVSSRWRGVALALLFAATVVLSGSTQALLPATATAFIANCPDDDPFCDQGPDEGGEDPGDWGDEGGDWGSGADDLCAIYSDCGDDDWDQGEDPWGEGPDDQGDDPYCLDFGTCPNGDPTDEQMAALEQMIMAVGIRAMHCTDVSSDLAIAEQTVDAIRFADAVSGIPLRSDEVTRAEDRFMALLHSAIDCGTEYEQGLLILNQIRSGYGLPPLTDPYLPKDVPDFPDPSIPTYPDGAYPTTGSAPRPHGIKALAQRSPKRPHKHRAKHRGGRRGNHR